MSLRIRGVFKNLYRGWGLIFLLYRGRGSAPVGALKPHEINRFLYSRGA